MDMVVREPTQHSQKKGSDGQSGGMTIRNLADVTLMEVPAPKKKMFETRR